MVNVKDMSVVPENVFVLGKWENVPIPEQETHIWINKDDQNNIITEICTSLQRDITRLSKMPCAKYKQIIHAQDGRVIQMTATLPKSAVSLRRSAKW